MVKLMGMLLVLGGSTLTGMFLAAGLGKRVASLERHIQLLGYLSDRLKYLRPSVAALLASAAEQRQFAALEYIPECLRKMEEGMPFPLSWRQAVEEYFPEREGKERALIASLAEVLGAADLDSQLTSLAYDKELLAGQLEEARAYRDAHSKLYRSLGVLCGLGLVIIFL